MNINQMPSPEDLDTLIKKLSGQFTWLQLSNIYPLIVIDLLAANGE